MDPAWVRLAFVLLGVTGPIIVAIYLGLYFDMYLNSDPEGIPRIDKARAIQSPLFCVAAAGALHLIARLLLYAIPVAYERYAGMGRLSDLGGWDWLRTHATVLLFCVLSGALPFALLSALPLSNQWDHSLKRVAQAILALYAVTLAFGIACFLVGMILHVVREFSV
jgi:hypothetical protein